MDELRRRQIEALIDEFNDNDVIWEENPNDEDKDIIENAQIKYRTI